MTKIFRENNKTKKFSKMKEGSYSELIKAHPEMYYEYNIDAEEYIEEEYEFASEKLIDYVYEKDWKELNIKELSLDRWIRIFKLEKTKNWRTPDYFKNNYYSYYPIYLDASLTISDNDMANFENSLLDADITDITIDDLNVNKILKDWVGNIQLGTYNIETKTLKFNYNYKNFPDASKILDNETFVTHGELDDSDCKNVKEMIIKHLKQFFEIDHIE